MNCMECGERIVEGGVIISLRDGHGEYRVHTGDCAESVKKKLADDVAVREITEADLERYKAIHEKFIKTIKDTYPTDLSAIRESNPENRQ